MTSNTRSRNDVRILAILGALVALGPLSTDFYVPALPQLADDVHASTSTAQLTITTCLAGLAVGQLLAGPLSDALGRRRPLLFGLALYAVAGVLCAVVPVAAFLVAMRFVQGAGGAFAIVIAYAAVRDRYSGSALARNFSLLLLVTGLAPVLSPIAGGQLMRWTNWQGIFIVLAVFTVLLILTAAVGLPESLPPELRRSGGSSQMWADFRQLFSDREFVGYTLANGFGFAAMFAYIAGSPFVLETIYGMSPQAYSLVFGINALGLVIAAQVSGRVVRSVGPRPLLRLGLAANALGGLGVVLAVASDAGRVPLLIALFVVVTSVGLIMPNAAALALEHHGEHAGAASALLGFEQFLFGGLAAPLVGLAGSKSAWPMAIVMAALGCLAFAVFALLTRAHRAPAVAATTPVAVVPVAPNKTS